MLALQQDLPELVAQLQIREQLVVTLEQLVQVQQDEAATRQQMAREILGKYKIRSQPYSFHIWLELPEPDDP